MAFLLVILFIVVPIAELYVIIKVGEAIGVLPTLALLFADAILGSLLLKHQGRGAWRRFNEALAARRFPGKEVADGAMIVVGGTLLLAPGFITDIAGLILLIPPSRAIVRRLFRSYFTRHVVIIGSIPGAFESRRPGGPGPSRDYDFDASAEEVPPNGDEPSRRNDPQLPPP
jgi:UPF0716 protein FxsA